MKLAGVERRILGVIQCMLPSLEEPTLETKALGQWRSLMNEWPSQLPRVMHQGAAAAAPRHAAAGQTVRRASEADQRHAAARFRLSTAARAASRVGFTQLKALCAVQMSRRRRGADWERVGHRGLQGGGALPQRASRRPRQPPVVPPPRPCYIVPRQIIEHGSTWQHSCLGTEHGSSKLLGKMLRGHTRKAFSQLA